MPNPRENRDDNTIFWDVEDWSILKDLDPELVVEKIKTDLYDRGYVGFETSIQAFFDDDIPENLLYASTAPGIVSFLVPKGNKHARVHHMTVHILLWAQYHRPCPSNLFILSENIKEDKQVASVVRSLNEKDLYNVVLLDPRILLVDCGRSPTKKWICDCCGDPFKKAYLDVGVPSRGRHHLTRGVLYGSARQPPIESASTSNP
ncbi:hypothetical protein ISN45_Aa08g030250 [Arabidopsis thaliana x Arabidopsis arenosa]|uniref:NYN domain-containing protein n=1 Tax=Arabidopsis thaliana x Arabidopsis arenosa TaxID=1240361 RepID=A0A8T1XMR7_9BRAS|nr:hypothetical protein ISN45_Aa08g030250 [Arabidopsis thaliana x Arabidopsis arenosa]